VTMSRYGIVVTPALHPSWVGKSTFRRQLLWGLNEKRYVTAAAGLLAHASETHGAVQEPAHYESIVCAVPIYLQLLMSAG
jgi:hypothetical protein